VSSEKDPVVSHGTSRAIVTSSSVEPGRGRRGRTLVVACTLIAAATAAVVNSKPAVASGPVILANGISGQLDGIRPISADSAGIVYSSTDPGRATPPVLYLRTTGGVTDRLSTAFQSIYAIQMVGSMVGSYSTPDRTFHYEHVGDFAARSVTIPTGVFESTAADGYLYSNSPSPGSGLHLYDVDVSAGTKIDLGAIPGNPDSVVAIATPDGVLVETRDAGAAENRSLWYQNYSSNGNFARLATNVPIVGAPVLDASSVAWLENPTAGSSAYDPAQTTVVRMSLGGSGGPRTAAPGGVELAITADFTGVATTLSAATTRTFMTAPSGGGRMTRYAVSISGDVVSSGDAFVVGQAGASGTAGLYRVVSAPSATAELISASAAPLSASSIALSPGRVVWRDNAAASGVVTRTLVNDNSALTIGAAVVVAPDPAGSVSAGATATSGAAIAYLAADKVWLARSGKASQDLGSSSADDMLTLSGERLLQDHDDGSATLFNLATSTVSSLPAVVGPWGGAFAGLTPYQLSGDELASMASDGSVSIEQLDTGQSQLVSNAIVGPGQTVIGSVAVEGHTVAWTEATCSPAGTFVSCGAPVLRYRDVADLGPVVTVSAVTAFHLVLASGYLAFDDESAGDRASLDVTALNSGIVDTIGPLEPGISSSFAVSQSTVGWIGSDGVPRVLALPHLYNQPWSLGAEVAPTTYTADGDGSWVVDLTTSDALTTCAVTIATRGKPVRSLPCDVPAMAIGDVTASWDGRDGQGQLVAAGSYTWTLQAGGTDGGLLDDTGSSAPISGTLVVSAHPAVALAASSSTGIAYGPVTMTATLPTASTRVVEFRDGTRIIGSVAPTSGGAALTTTGLGTGSHSITASFVPAGQTSAVESAPVVVSLTAGQSAGDQQAVEATVSPGDITITTPYTPQHPLDLGTLELDSSGTRLSASAPFGDPANPAGAIEVTDTRSGDANWSVTVQASDLAQQHGSATINGQNLGLTGLTALPLPGNALNATSVALTDAPVPAVPVGPTLGGIAGLGGVPHLIASSVGGGDGTIGIFGTLTLEAPTSTPSGIYQGTLAFTVG
jgi:hypothetical protein